MWIKSYLSALKMSEVHCISVWTMGFEIFFFLQFYGSASIVVPEKSALSISRSSAFVMSQFHPLLLLLTAHVSPRDHRVDVYPPAGGLLHHHWFVAGAGATAFLWPFGAHVLLSVRRFVSLQSLVGWLLSLSAIFACVRRTRSLCPSSMSVPRGWHAMQIAGPPSLPFTNASFPPSAALQIIWLCHSRDLDFWLLDYVCNAFPLALCGTGHGTLAGSFVAIWPGLRLPPSILHTQEINRSLWIILHSMTMILV